MLKNGIAYITITAFNENTGKEFDEKLRKLGEKNLKGLVLDLRENPGGLLNEGIDVAGHFLKKNEMVVSHHGRIQGSNKEYRTRFEGTGKDYPVVVLVNRRTASAAEIVSGALQDHDRAWILGEPTFGKGLVQTVFPLSDNTGLALTTAQYLHPQRTLHPARLFQHFVPRLLHPLQSRPAQHRRRKDDRRRTHCLRRRRNHSGRTLPCTPSTIRLLPIAPPPPSGTSSRPRSTASPDSSTSRSATSAPRPTLRCPRAGSPTTEWSNSSTTSFMKNNVRLHRCRFHRGPRLGQTRTEARNVHHRLQLRRFPARRYQQDPAVQKAIDSMPNAKKLLDNAKKLLVERISQRPVQAQ